VDFTLVAVVVLALFFDYTNGFHDAANAIATTVSTRALPPRLAVGLAGVLNFLGAFVSIQVATTVGKGVVDTNVVTTKVVLAAIVAAITWNLITWFLGLPTSSSHALIGGVAGAGIAAGGWQVVQWKGVTEKILIPSVLSPMLGLVVAGLITLAIMWGLRRRNPHRVNRLFRRLQLVSAAAVALTHGTNDAQKTMGVIALALVASNPGSTFHVPLWVIASAALAMAAGTYSGGWRIIRTLGRRVTHLDPYQGFAAETATAMLLYTTAHFGFPVSTTHTISGSVLGAGAVRRLSAVRWGIVRSILVAWLVTLPAAAIVAAVMEYVTRLPGGEVIVFVLAVAIAVLAFWASARLTAGVAPTTPVAPPPAPIRDREETSASTR
jgi:inorganic phosphate transporter, PiT family